MIAEINNNPNNVTSAIIGFVPDISAISTEIDQINAVQGEYANSVSTGGAGAGYEDLYNEFVQKLEAAGLQRVMDELQVQLDAFLGK